MLKKHCNQFQKPLCHSSRSGNNCMLAVDIARMVRYRDMDGNELKVASNMDFFFSESLFEIILSELCNICLAYIMCLSIYEYFKMDMYVFICWYSICSDLNLLITEVNIDFLCFFVRPRLCFWKYGKRFLSLKYMLLCRPLFLHRWSY